MKINQYGKDVLKISEERTKGPERPRTDPPRSESTRRDEVRISQEVRDLLQAEKASDAGNVRTELVESLRQRIRQGSYAPDSGDVADRWLADLRKESRGE